VVPDFVGQVYKDEDSEGGGYVAFGMLAGNWTKMLWASHPMLISWENPDMDGGLSGAVQVLVGLPCPDDESHTWKIIGNIRQGILNRLAFEVLLDIDSVDDGYGGRIHTIRESVQTTKWKGDCSDIEWEEVISEVLYSYYDQPTDMMNLAVRIKPGSNNWVAAGSYVRVA